MSDTLLYIDPDPAVRLLIRKALAPVGFTVLEAGDVATARRTAERDHLDAVVVDVDVVGRSATDLVGIFRQWPGTKNALLFATTADDRPEHLQATTACGFTVVLTKPLDVDVLAAALKPHVAMPSAPAPTAVTTLETATVTAPTAATTHETGTVTASPAPAQRRVTPFTEHVVKAAAAADACIALFEPDHNALTVVAAHSARPAVLATTVGLSIAVASVPWMQHPVEQREPVVIDPTTTEASPLLPPTSTAVLVVPVATAEKVYGVLLIGERRRRAYAFPPTHVAESVAHAQRLAAVLEEYERLEVSIKARRQQLERHRVETTRALAAVEGSAEPKEERELMVRLTSALAEHLDLSEADRAVLGQAVEVHDVGRRWIENALLRHGALPAESAAAVIDDHGEQTLQILAELEWPSAVIDLVKSSHAYDNGRVNGGTNVALPAQIMGIVAAYQRVVRAHGTDGTASDRETIGQLLRELETRFDPAVVRAFARLIGQE